MLIIYLIPDFEDFDPIVVVVVTAYPRTKTYFVSANIPMYCFTTM